MEVLFFFISLILIVFIGGGIYQHDMRKKIKSNGLELDAQIENLIERPDGFDGPYLISNILLRYILKPKNDIYIIEYKFSVNNRVYRKTQRLFKKDCPIDPSNKIIKIKYLKTNPNISLPSFLLEQKRKNIIDKE